MFSACGVANDIELSYAEVKDDSCEDYGRREMMSCPDPECCSYWSIEIDLSLFIQIIDLDVLLKSKERHNPIQFIEPRPQA
jgi:hypothetical protein